MSPRVPPLPEGTVLEERYEILRPLGSGGFGITYLARDLERRDECVLKELAPAGVRRDESGRLDLNALGPAQAQRLRQQFFQEAKTLRRSVVRGILPWRDHFEAFHTAYLVVDYLPGALDLGRVLQAEGPIDPQGVLDIVFALLDTLEALHSRGILHRDIKPSNILLSPKGEVYLIDFGSAREWHAGAHMTHTVQFTPGFAPLEQLSERGKRGPATDVYALCATAYALLTGFAPPSSQERAGGTELMGLADLVPELDPGVARAIELGLALRYEDRPRDVAEMRALLSADVGSEDPPNPLDLLDDKRLQLQRLRPGKRECPACSGVLAEPTPLRPGVCPVCRAGSLRTRSLSERRCAACGVGVLRRVENRGPLAFCPVCKSGRLKPRGVLAKKRWVCESCQEGFALQGADVVREHTGEPATWAEWRRASGRAEEVWCCDACPGQFDVLDDGRWRLSSASARGHTTLFPEEWARVAAGLDPDQGNAECPSCGADFFSHEGRLTLLATAEDPYGFARQYLGQALSSEAVAWVGVGKTSGHPGLLCESCHSEWDWSGRSLQLVSSPQGLLRAQGGEVLSLEDWHRCARGLPLVGDEANLDAEIEAALRQSYRQAQPLGTRDSDDWIWEGPAERVDWDGDAWRVELKGQLKIGAGTIRWGRGLRKFSIGVRMLARVELEEDVLTLAFRDGTEFNLLIEPITLEAGLQSGPMRIELTAEDLVARLQAEKELLG
ncbi:MAG TPA: serine/threonine-protein kinase [Fimbriimonadaceae bacterium]|nr:serine/threonine-protein kinase [Fimbriimonadaceae bacterium]HRJ33556.1 serine/threonine-protein kinase [Fimbriimonadaceae bacterium]